LIVIDIGAESLLTLSKAAGVLPGQPHVSTLFRWATRGVRGVKLETCLLGGRRYTSRQALQRFSSAATGATQRYDESRKPKLVATTDIGRETQPAGEGRSPTTAQATGGADDC
jgi:hypothetical protein